MMRSLRSRLLAGTTLTLVAIMSVLGMAIDQSARLTLRRQFDAGLLAHANAITTMVKGKKDEVKLESMARAIPDFLPDEHQAYFELWAGDQEVGRSASLEPKASLGGPPRTPLTEGEHHVEAFRLPDGRPGRLLTMSFYPLRDPGGNDKDDNKRATVMATVRVARDTLDLDQMLLRLRWLTAGLFAAATAISGGVLVALVNRTTRPVRRLADDIAGLTATDLSPAMSVRGMPSELVPVVERLNALLGRLAEAFTLERSFTANVAHELRTPLAGILATLEVCRSRPRGAVEMEAAIDESLVMLGQMQSLVDNLLLLARADGGQLKAGKAQADLSALARECWRLFEGRAQARSLHVTLELPGPCAVSGDAALLRIVLNNLFDNAVSYADEGGRIAVSVARTEGAAEVCVINSGNELTPEEAGRVYERFWRKESARSETGLHAGLGLSLCQRLMTLHGGAMRVAVEGGEFRAMAAFTS